MKIKNWTKVIIVAGFIWLAVAISWFSRNPDPSQLFVYLAIGIGILCFGGLIEWILRIRQYYRDLKKRVDNHDVWITDYEKKKEN